MRFLLVFLLLILLSFTLSAQHPALKAMEAALEEKIKIKDWEAWLEFHQGSDTTSHIETIEEAHEAGTRGVFGEVRIGNTQKPESEIHAAIDPADSSRMMVAVMRHDPFVMANPLSFSLYSTEDFGQTWFQSPFRADQTGNVPIAGGGDPVLVYDSDGTAHLVWLLLTYAPQTNTGKVGLYYAKTSDQGLTWNQPPSSPSIFGSLMVPPGTTTIVASDRYVDKPWLAIDQSSGLFRDQIYMAFFEIQISPIPVLTIQCAKKARSASNFSTSTTQVNTQSYADLQFASIDVDQNSVVHVSFFASLDGTNYALYHARSTNGASSFEPETKISDLSFPAPTNPGNFPSPITGIDRLYPCPHIQVDQSDGPFSGNLYATWTAQGTGQSSTSGFDIYFARSTDGGATWQAPIKVNDDPNPALHQFYSSIEVSPSGIVLLSWYDRRDDPNNLDTHYYMAYSTDGGQSFQDQFVVSGQASDFSVIGSQNEAFGIGEYTQIVSSSGYAIPFWADGRGNDGQVKVYTGFVPIDAQPVTGLDRWQSLSDQLVLQEPYPNPTNDRLYLSWELKEPTTVNLQLLDAQGKLVQDWHSERLVTGQHQHEINLAGIAAGSYILMMEAGEAIAGRKIQIE